MIEIENNDFNKFDAGKKLSADLKINFENINKTNKTIVEELEKKFAFVEESAKMLLNQNNNNSDKIGFEFLFGLINSEKSKVKFADIKKYIIDENIFLCEHIFKSINYASLFLAYLTYISENPAITENYNNMFKLSGLDDLDNADDTAEINLNLKLNEKFSVNNLLQYISLFGFEILVFYYDREQNSVDISIDISDISKDSADIKNRMAGITVFIDLLKYYGISEIAINL